MIDIKDIEISSNPDDIKVLLCQIQREVETMIQDTNATLLLHDGKIAECCKYLKDNLSNSIRHLLDDMKYSGEIEKIISETIMCSINKRVIFIDTVKALKESILQKGDVIKTLGYHQINDGGQAIYKIRKQEVSDHANDGTIILLPKGLVAEMIIENESINIKSLGAKHETDCTKIFRSLSTIKDIKLILPEETYIITDTVDLHNVTFEGNGTVIRADSQKTEREHIIQFTGKINIKNIDFVQNCITSMCYFGNTEDSTIENCKFIVNHAKCNGYVDLYTNNKNMLFKKCTFDCFSEKNGNIQAGGVWVREYNSGKITENITFDNCNFKHYSKDETIAVWNWNGTVENVIVNNCTFKDYDGCDSPHFITMAIDSGKIINSLIERNGDSSSESDHITIIKSDIDGEIFKPTIQNCTLKLNTPLHTAIFKGACIVNNCYVTNKKKCKINSGKDLVFEGCNFEIEKFSLNNATFNNCKFTMLNKDTSISTENALVQGDITLTNCVFKDFIFGSYLLHIIYEGSKITMDNVRFVNPDISNLNQFINSSVTYNQKINNCDIYKNVYMPKATGYLINCRLTNSIDGDYKGETVTNNNIVCL